MSIPKGLDDLQQDWNVLGARDPLWAVLSAKNKQGNKWDVKEFFANGVREINGLLEYLSDLGLVIPRSRALDFGCGVGRLSQALAVYFDEVCGVDIAQTMVERARQFNKFGDKCSYYVNTRDDLQLFPDADFSFIYTTLVLQHMEPRYAKRYIREFLRILKPNGVLVFQLLGERYGWQNKVKAMLPRHLLNLYYRIKLGEAPKIVIFGIPHQEVCDLLIDADASIVNFKRNLTKSGWVNYVYVVTKGKGSGHD